MALTSITTVYAALACVALALVLATLVGFALSRVGEPGRARWQALRDTLTPAALPAAWLVAALATLGSLYLSEIAGLIPCQLCWFQRIAMYPLVALLGVATLRGDVAGAKRYATVFAMVGAVLAAYHYQLERFPSQPTLTCAAEAPCSIPVVNVWGFASVPFMALAAFLLILTVLLLARQAAAPNGD